MLDHSGKAQSYATLSSSPTAAVATSSLPALSVSLEVAMSGFAAGVGGVWHRGTKTLVLARPRLVRLTASSTVVTCDSASAKQDGRHLRDNLGTIFPFLFKVYCVRLKVYSFLYKMRNVVTLPQQDLVMPRSGTSLTRSSTTVSQHQESRRSSREVYR